MATSPAPATQLSQLLRELVNLSRRAILFDITLTVLGGARNLKLAVTGTP